MLDTLSGLGDKILNQSQASLSLQPCRKEIKPIIIDGSSNFNCDESY